MILYNKDGTETHMTVEPGMVFCPNCLNLIDPDVCHCGDPIKGHAYETHSPVPMGCACSRADFKRPYLRVTVPPHGTAEHEDVIDRLSKWSGQKVLWCEDPAYAGTVEVTVEEAEMMADPEPVNQIPWDPTEMEIEDIEI